MKFRYNTLHTAINWGHMFCNTDVFAFNFNTKYKNNSTSGLSLIGLDPYLPFTLEDVIFTITKLPLDFDDSGRL